MPSAAPDEPQPASFDTSLANLTPLTLRLRDRLGALIGAGIDHDRFGIAVSGGPDSMALLALMQMAFPGRIEAATVDHQLRPESGDEAEMVARWCASHDVPHTILYPPEPITGNLQATARAVRYRLLDGWRTGRQLDWILTAHHADDQAETLLMRLNRGSGVGGLAGVRARNGYVLRPLLDWRRSELEAVCSALALPFACDPSNADPRFDRAAMRMRMAQAEWLDPAAIARSAAALGEAEQALGWMVDNLAREHVSRDAQGAIILDRTDVPREILRRLVLHMLTLADPAAAPPRGDTLDQALVQLYAGKKTSIGNLLLSGGKRWAVRPAPPRRKS